MRVEVYENFDTGVDLVVFNGSDVVAIYYADEIGDVMEKIDILANKDDKAYLEWDYCYHTDNVAEATVTDNVEKCDEDGNPVDITEHPWTMEELYDDLRENADLIEEYDI